MPLSKVLLQSERSGDFIVGEHEFSDLEIRLHDQKTGFHYFYDTRRRALVKQFRLQAHDRVDELCTVTLVRSGSTGLFEPRLKFWKRDTTKSHDAFVLFLLEHDSAQVVLLNDRDLGAGASALTHEPSDGALARAGVSSNDDQFGHKSVLRARCNASVGCTKLRTRNPYIRPNIALGPVAGWREACQGTQDRSTPLADGPVRERHDPLGDDRSETSGVHISGDGHRSGAPA